MVYGSKFNNLFQRLARINIHIFFKKEIFYFGIVKSKQLKSKLEKGIKKKKRGGII